MSKVVKKYRTNKTLSLVVIFFFIPFIIYGSLKLNGYKALTGVLVFGGWYYWMAAYGWNDIFFYRNKMVFSNYLAFWRVSKQFYYRDIKAVKTEIYSRKYYIILYLKNGEEKRFVVGFDANETKKVFKKLDIPIL